jgi:TolA-binding protein
MSGNQIRRRRIQPKLRSMPTSKSPSAIYIQMHQLATERERLQQELVRLCDRQNQIIKRLKELDQGLEQLEANATGDSSNNFDLSQIDPATAEFIEARLNRTERNDQQNKANGSKSSQSKKQSRSKSRSTGTKNEADYSSMTIEY